MLSIKRLPFLLFTLLILLSIINLVVAKKLKHKHDHDDDEDEDEDDWWGHDDDDDDKDHKTKVGKPEYITPTDEEWLEGIDFDDIEGEVRPVGSGICKNAKCDGTDNDECFESCGNIASPEDVYGCQKEKTWALTFDDGPSNFTNQLLDILDDAKIKATFVVMGAHAKMYPDVIRRAFESGHQIASHTYSHPHLMSLSNEEIVYEVRATEEAIIDAIGVKPKYLRPPYGEADDRVKSILKQMGYKVLMWNVDPTDYNVYMLKDGAERIQTAFEKATNGSENFLNVHMDKGYISLQHDLYTTSIAQVPHIVKKLKAKGYEFMTAAECVDDDEPHDREARALMFNAQNAPTEADIKRGEENHQQAEQVAQETSDSSFTYPVMTFILAAIGFSILFN